jgi:DNA repair protein SbcC/Rad50
MQLNRIRLLNFRQHENTEIEFGPGLTGIIGPNGAGKTTILEAIAWAMYGMPAARGNRDTLRRRGAAPRARVEVEVDFTLGAHHYRIIRSLNQAELYQDGDAAPVAYSIGAVTERVTRLLGMTREEFFNTYFTGQKDLAVMAAMSAPERAQFLSRVLGYDRLRAAQDRLREKRSALRARLDALRAGMPDLTELQEAEQRATQRLELATAKPGQRSRVRPRKSVWPRSVPAGNSCNNCAKPLWPWRRRSGWRSIRRMPRATALRSWSRRRWSSVPPNDSSTRWDGN